jgi:hypothetical protein
MKIYNVVLDKYDYLIEAEKKEEALDKAKQKHAAEAKILDLDSAAVKVQTATAKERFDFALKQLLINGACFLPGKTLSSEDEKENGFGLWLANKKNGKKRYDRYLSFPKKIKEALDENIIKAYTTGKGNEFSTGKFYSVGSSSRFVVSSFSKCDKTIIAPIEAIDNNLITDFDFEHPCPIGDKFPIPPQLDASFKIGQSQYFIEAKCHEIFDLHKRLQLKEKYEEPLKELILLIKNEHIKSCSLKYGRIYKYNYIGKSKNDVFELLTSKDFGVDRKSTHFDFKQFLCHLIGIISDKAENKKFYYLFYRYDNKAKDENFNFSKTYCQLEKELGGVAKAFVPVFEKYKIEFGYLYNNKFDTLTREQWDKKVVLYPQKETK